HQDRDGGVVKDMARGATKNELSEARAAEATHDEEVGAVSRDLCEQFDTGIAARAGLDPLNVGFDAVAGERRADLCTRDIVRHLGLRWLLDGQHRYLLRLLEKGECIE